MKTTENFNTEYKSLKKITTGDKGIKDLATTCVSFANAQGGVIYIGIEDKDKKAPAGQVITDESINDAFTRLKANCVNVGLVLGQIELDETGGQYFSITVQPSMKSIATTSDGKIYTRVGDKCEPVKSEDIIRLASEKDAFQWELQAKNLIINEHNRHNIELFANDIRQSDRVKPFVKEKSDIEIAEHYSLILDQQMTNIGVLWIGTASQRSRLAYPLTVQYIVYDDLETKLRKDDWHDYSMNPKELLLDIESKAIELTYSDEFPQGLFRNKIRHYDQRVIRELLINAFAHKSYTTSADIFIEVYPDRLKISNPGSLPLGVTKDNILRERQRRNPHIIKVLHDLKLMEGEGSGYDLIYEIAGRDGKQFPMVESDFNSVSVTLESKILDIESVLLIDFIAKNYQLSQNDYIVLGIVSKHKKITSPTLTKELQLSNEERLRTQVKKLVEQSILISRGVKKGTEYLINPKLIASSKINIKPTLKTIEQPRLKALIEEILKINPELSSTEIHQKLGDVAIEDIRKSLYKMVIDGILEVSGGKTYRKYFLAKKNRKEKGTANTKRV